MLLKRRELWNITSSHSHFLGLLWIALLSQWLNPSSYEWLSRRGKPKEVLSQHCRSVCLRHELVCLPFWEMLDGSSYALDPKCHLSFIHHQNLGKGGDKTRLSEDSYFLTVDWSCCHHLLQHSYLAKMVRYVRILYTIHDVKIIINGVESDRTVSASWKTNGKY